MYTIEIKKKAEKDIDGLSKKEQSRVLAALDVLRENPFAGKKLHGEHEGAWSLRVWPYRIVYTIERSIITVTVVAIGQRKDVYRR